MIAKDVCEVLVISNPTMALKRLDEDEKALISIEGLNRGNEPVNIINESGLYSLILTSRKPEAKSFKRWITHEVIPSLRKTGSYVVSKQNNVPALPTAMPTQTKANIREAKKIFAFIREEMDVLTPEVHRALLSHATELLTGKPLEEVNNTIEQLEPKKLPRHQTKKQASFVNLQLGQVLQNFCSELDINLPDTNDLSNWWEEILYQMDKEKIQFLLEQPNFKNSNHWVIQKMYNQLEKRKVELENLN